MSEELSEIARGLGQFDAKGGLVGMLVSLVAASREFIGIADLECNALFVNDAGRKLVGLPDLQAALSTRIIDYFAKTTNGRYCTKFCLPFAMPGFGKGN